MFILMFTRLTDGTREVIFSLGAYDSKREAQDEMRKELAKRITEMGWDSRYSYIYGNQAFCGTESMRDTCRFYIFDTEHPYGFDNDLLYEFFGDDE